jgi:hypothetical protein
MINNIFSSMISCHRRKCIMKTEELNSGRCNVNCTYRINTVRRCYFSCSACRCQPEFIRILKEDLSPILKKETKYYTWWIPMSHYISLICYRRCAWAKIHSGGVGKFFPSTLTLNWGLFYPMHRVTPVTDLLFANYLRLVKSAKNVRKFLHNIPCTQI